MKTLKIFLFSIIVLSFLAFIPSGANAAESISDDDFDSNIHTIGNGEYAISKYRIEITVNENNTFFVREYITAYFYKTYYTENSMGKHGILLTMSARNEVTRLDGTKTTKRVGITGIKVEGDQYKVFNEGGSKVIQIGDPKKAIPGNTEKEYIISYLYDIGEDACEGYDEFYFNLTGNDWDTTISGIEFKITMPKEFDESKLGFSAGAPGSTDNSNVSYKVNGNVIKGRYNGVLGPYETLTVRTELPDGYFAGAADPVDLVMILAIILPLILFGIVFVLWFRYGKDETVIETVEFYPPEGYNSAEVGFLYRGTAKAVDVVSLLIYLADKGYVAISETLEKTIFSNQRGFRITKIKEYDGHDPNERLFLNGLFKEKNEVTHIDLKNSFYTTLDEINKNINRKENYETIFEKSSLNKIPVAIIMAAAAFALISYKPMIEFNGFIASEGYEAVSAADIWPFMLMFPSLGFTFLIKGLINAKVKGSDFDIIFGAMFGGIPFAFMILPTLIIDQIYLLTYIIGTIAATGMLVFAKYMKKRTAFGNEILGKITGFRNFLNTAEKPKLEALVMQNPAYFYNILPFTYVLGLSDKWIRKFENIAMVPPDWYGGSGSFSSASFGSFMNHTMTTATSAMSSSPSGSGFGSRSGSGSGGSSGGGSAGGGYGSRGGRSW